MTIKEKEKQFQKFQREVDNAISIGYIPYCVIKILPNGKIEHRKTYQCINWWKYVDIFIWCLEFIGYTIKEIAKFFSMPQQRIKEHIFHARYKIRLANKR